MHHRPDREKNCHSRAGGNPQPIGGERKVQLIMFTYFSIFLLIIEIDNFLVYWQGCISLL